MRTSTSLSRRPRTIARVLLGVVWVLAALCLFTAPALAGPPPMAGGRPDPRAMSGIPRIDPQVPPGSLTVRCLLGSFDKPAVGVTVTLQLRSADGATTDARTTVTVEQGRATFDGLEAFFGGSAVASVTFDGDSEPTRSQSISVDARAGSRVMLVQGAASAPAGPAGPANPHAGGASAPHGGGDVPMPGQPFASPRFAVGSAVVGTLDLNAGKPLSGIEVVLRGTTPEGATLERRANSDDDGRAQFSGLLGEDVPEGTQWIAEATLLGEPRRSQPFTLPSDQGMAVILATGGAPAPEHGAQPEAPPQRRPLMPPTRVPSEAPGTVRVHVIDAEDKPVAGATVRVRRESVTGQRVTVEVDTLPGGVARAEVDISEDSLYQAEVVHDGAPFRSSLFRMDERSGVALELRLFDVTTDPSRVQGEVQFVFEPREKNLVQVIQFFHVFVSGDEAFWPGDEFRLQGAEGCKSFTVMSRSSDVLSHDEEAPFATLDGPIPPGEVVELSVAYLLEHDGAATMRWVAPFKLVGAAAVLDPTLELTRGATAPPVQSPPDPRRPVMDIYKLGVASAGQPIELEVSGLAVNELARTLRGAGLLGGVTIGLGIVVLMIAGARRSTRAQLLQRRDALYQALEAVEAEGGVEVPGVQRGGAARRPGAKLRRRLIIAALDQVYRDLDGLADAGAGEPKR